MTVTYSLNVANAKLTGFSKLLLRWKGSIYKLLYREMVIFVGLYYCLSFLYRYLLTESQRIVFEKIALYCEAFTNLVPLTFVLGFYVSIVVTRWWQQFMQIPWPDKLVCLVAGNVHGTDERGRIIRRTLARYLLLLQTLTCQAVSTSVRRRFPTLDHVEEAGIMTKEERMVFDEIPGSHGKWWAPTVWFTNLVVRARKEGRIKDDHLLQQILEELHVFRCCCGMMFAYDWISIPLVYTQTVTIATYTYFLATVMGRQYLDPSKGYSNHDVDLYIPVFTIFEFFFFMGWLKVAEQLINPYGEDDDDFELNWCLDRNLLISFWIVDEMHNKHPRLVKDLYWDDAEPALPYTKSSAGLRARSTGAHHGSAMDLAIDPDDTEFVPLETIMEEDNDQTYSSPPTSPGNDLISMGTPGVKEAKEASNNNIDATSHSLAFRSLADSFKGSRLFNIIIGQSSENVAQTPKLGYVDRQGHLGTPLIPPFILKTPKKRTRTTSVGNAMHPAVSSLQMHSLDTDGPMSRATPSNLTVGYGDLPTAPVILTHRTPTRQGTPVADRRSTLANESRDSTTTVDMTTESPRITPRVVPSQVASRYPGADGFKFPASFVPGQGLYRRSSVDGQESVDDGDEEPGMRSGTRTPNVGSGRTSRAADVASATIIGMESVSLSSASIRETGDDCLMTSPGAASEGGVPAIAAEESPYEPNLSDESLTPYDSNQSTVTSITELIKMDKKDK